MYGRAAALRRKCQAVGAADAAPQPPASLLPDVEKSAQPLSVTAGRPNVPALLDFVASRGAAEREIGVIAAGALRSVLYFYHIFMVANGGNCRA